MGKYVAVLNQKGGVGKTTVSYNLASELADLGDTRLVDADPQASAAGWVTRAPSDRPYPAICSELADPNQVRQLRSETEAAWTVIDGPPSLDSPMMQAALAVADLAIIPITPSVIDLTSMIEATVVSVNEAMKTNPTLMYAVLINRRQIGTNMSTEVRNALQAEGIPVFTTEWSQSTAHVSAAAEGVPVKLYRGWNWRATHREIQSLVEEVKEVLS